jgi:predicted amidohydrolase
MAEKLVVACVQQRMRLPHTVDDFRNDLTRFMRAAQNKSARLVVFPELAGLMVALPLLADVRSGMLKRADRGRRRRASFWERVNGALAGSMASAMRADLRISVGGLLDVSATEMWHSYTTVFGELAREFNMTIVAPSAYLPDPFDGVIRNLTGVFGANGELLGTQSKVLLHPDDEDLAQAGAGWEVVPSDVGRLGIMIGSDVLYPEVGRLLAYQGAEVLICQGACPDPILYNKVRSGMLARMQENQLFGLVSFLVGSNELSRRQRTPFVGKSAIFAPQELTPRYNGVLVEMGNQRSEGVLTAEWDFQALRDLWESSDTPVRQNVPPMQVKQLMETLYARLQAADRSLLAADDSVNGEDGQGDDETVELEELIVQASITSRWPLPNQDAVESDFSDVWEEPATQTLLRNGDSDEPSSTIRYDDETDEMDALPRPDDEG